MVFFLRIFLLLPFSLFAYVNEIDLSRYEQRIYSQNGEDGVLAKIMEFVGIEQGFCVEFGALDGYMFSNTLQFRNKGWEAVLFDSVYENPTINLYQALITKKNITNLFAEYNVPQDLDLLSIDIDSNDWHIWHALGSQYRPKVLVIEYNRFFGPTQDKIIPYELIKTWDGISTYYGASLMAYYRLGRHFGYSLVYAERNGINAFFIRDDILVANDLHFKNVNNVQKIYRGNGIFIKELQDQPLLSSSDYCINGSLLGKALQPLTIPQCEMDFAYRACCQNALTDESCFNTFKNNPAYTPFLEHLGYETGLLLLDIIQRQSPQFIDNIEVFKKNDLYGGPMMRTFDTIGTLSPTTLQYMKVASDLELLFGSLDGKSIVEIGGGYGGQCLILSMLHNFKSYTIIDLPEPLALTKKYLEMHGVHNVVYISSEEEISEQTFDLVVSNYAFAECCRPSKGKYLRDVISYAKKGYLTGEAFQEEVASWLDIHKVSYDVIPENPQTSIRNVVMTWKEV